MKASQALGSDLDVSSLSMLYLAGGLDCSRQIRRDTGKGTVV